jgi:aspartyl-tRNA(Asn)/glutamyl-tRNA(Gln) amidotransferase subunit B
MTNNFTPVIGIEIHVELKTYSKMFCGCKNDPFGAPKPNMYTCPVCLGLPGALPVPNKKAVEWTILLGLALGCKINHESKFDRKHYFYPDLPKGYQISQYDMPLCRNGVIHLSCGDVRIHRVHLEEDTGKLQHTKIDGKPVTLVDFNRSGVPLMEIVTEPDIHSSEQAKEFLKKLHQIIRYLNISGADMEKGSMRLEPNISVQKPGELSLPNYKVEVKNINSFNFVKKAIDYEIQRHIELLSRGEIPVQETRGWNEGKGITVSQRSKEEAHDYRYFPEPDIPPMKFEESQITKLKSQIPELPDTKKERFMKSFGLSEYDVLQLIDEPEMAKYYEDCISYCVSRIEYKSVTPKRIANWMINKKADTRLTPDKFIAQIAKATMVEDVSDDIVNGAISRVIASNAKAVADFKSGKQQALMFLFGNVLRELKGKGDKKKIIDLFQMKLKG